MVYSLSRLKSAKAINDELQNLERPGVRSARLIGRRIRVSLLRAFQSQNTSFRQVIDKESTDFIPMILDGMLAAHLRGRLRSMIVIAPEIKKRFALSPYSSAVEYMRKRANLTKDDIERLSKQYYETAVEVTRNLGNAAEKAAKQAMLEITQKGVHSREGIMILRRNLDAIGVTAESSYLLETLVRTQISIGYGAGRWDVMQDPDIQEILWGYEYSAVDDDRVRANHLALDGIQLPKNHPKWSEIWPPNGFNCRCTTFEMFDPPDGYKEFPDKVEVEGVSVIPEPDIGWDFNPGEMFKGVLRSPQVPLILK